MNAHSEQESRQVAKKSVYLDYAATTPAAPSVIKIMTQCLGIEGIFGNPASLAHQFGREAEQAVETARGQLAELINADPAEIVWTSGATEAIGVVCHEQIDDGESEQIIFFIHGGRLLVAEMKAQQRKARLRIHDTHPDDPLYKTACGRAITDAVLTTEEAGGDVTSNACRRMDFTDFEHLAMLRQ